MQIRALDGDGDETFRAVKAGLELQAELKSFATSVEQNFDEEFKIRIGVHFGEAIVGMLGCRGTERLSVIGDTVNMAARAESANKEADTTMLITENAYNQIKDRVEVEDFIRTKLMKLDIVWLKNFFITPQIYEVTFFKRPFLNSVFTKPKV